MEHAFIFCKNSVNLAGIDSLEELEHKYLLFIIEKNGGNKSLAAKELGIHKATLFRKLKRV